MLFSLKEFEHFFSEAVLRKGLQLFENGKIRLLPEKSGDNRVFQVASREISIGKRGDKVISYSCSCSKSYFCEHLAAMAFYFQRDTFSSKSGKTTGEAKKTPAELYLFALGKTKDKRLKAFYKSLSPGTTYIKTLFDTQTPNDFELYVLKWQLLFSSYNRKAVISDADINVIIQELEKQRETHRKDGAAIFELSVLVTLSELMGHRFSGDENRIIIFCRSLLAELQIKFSKGPDRESKELWTKAVTKLLRTDHLFYEVLLFILPRALTLSRSRTYFSDLSVLLENRKYKRKYSEHFDSLLVAKWMLNIRQFKVFKTSFPIGADKEGIEYSLAKAELFFCSGKPERGFGVLQEVYETWSLSQKRHGSFFRDHLIQRAVEYGNAPVETLFLRESLVYDLYILPDKLKRYLAIVHKDKLQYEVDEVIRNIRSEKSPLSQDKINTLLFETKRLDDLMQELKKQDNALLAVHKVALLKLPFYDDHILNIYLKQLMQAFSDRRVFHRPEDLFTFAMEYFGKLPALEREKIREKILSKLGGRSMIHKFVTELFSNNLHSDGPADK